jgi:hypothetical protein
MLRDNLNQIRLWQITTTTRAARMHPRIVPRIALVIDMVLVDGKANSLRPEALVVFVFIPM